MRPIRRYGLGRKTYISRPAQRWDSPRFRIPQRVVLHAESVAVPKIGMIRAVIHRPLVGVTKGATLKREADGHWYVALVVEQPAAPRTARPVQSHVGVDVGLKALAVYSTGETIANPHWYRTQTRKLRRARKARKGSRSGAAWGFCAPETMAYGTRFHPKPPTSGSAWPILCALRGLRGSHVRLRVVLLNVRGLAKTKLAKSVVDAGWGLFRSMLEYKADRNDTYVVAIGRFFASSKTCGACGLVNADLTLADRVWTCPCGVQHDRDLNAARNIDDEGLRLFALRFAAGYAETQNACGDPVSPIVVDVG